MNASPHHELSHWLAAQQPAMTNELIELCNINSGSESLDGLHKVADWLVNYLAPFQRVVRRISLPEMERIDDQGNIIRNETGPALRCDFDGEACPPNAKRLLLSIHYDTVYGPESPFQQCTQIEPDRLRGPGVIDAKGGIVVLRWAALAACKFFDLSRLKWSILLTPDEEIGSPSTTSLWQEIATDFDFAMLFEPTLSDGSMVKQRKGTGTFVMVVRGKSAHAGRNFSAGRNAVVHASKMLLELDGLNGARPDVTVNVGRIRGGDAVNVVPDLAVIRANVRVTTPQDQQWVETQVQRIVQKHNAPELGYSTSLYGGIHSPPKPCDASTESWMRRVEQIGKQIGEPIAWQASGGASDGNKLAAFGIPNIDTFGPNGDLLHSDQEWVQLSSLPRRAALAAALIGHFAE